MSHICPLFPLLIKKRNHPKREGLFHLFSNSEGRKHASDQRCTLCPCSLWLLINPACVGPRMCPIVRCLWVCSSVCLCVCTALLAGLWLFFRASGKQIAATEFTPVFLCIKIDSRLTRRVIGLHTSMQSATIYTPKDKLWCKRVQRRWVFCFR